MGAIERAKIYELDTTGKQVNPNNPIDVCFNPKEYSLDKALSWDSSKAHDDAPVPEFQTPAPMTLTVTLQFDTYEERVSVRDKYIRRLELLCLMKSPATSTKDVKDHAPPRVMFLWGAMTFRGVIQSLGQKYTMFLADGTPVRAEVALKMQQVDTSAAAMEDPTKIVAMTVNATRTHPVVTGDRLDSIASTMLGSASRWAEIADLNGIDNPYDLTAWVGQTIQIPAS